MTYTPAGRLTKNEQMARDTYPEHWKRARGQKFDLAKWKVEHEQLTEVLRQAALLSA